MVDGIRIQGRTMKVSRCNKSCFICICAIWQANKIHAVHSVNLFQPVGNHKRRSLLSNNLNIHLSFDNNLLRPNNHNQ